MSPRFCSSETNEGWTLAWGGVTNDPSFVIRFIKSHPRLVFMKRWCQTSWQIGIYSAFFCCTAQGSCSWRVWHSWCAPLFSWNIKATLSTTGSGDLDRGPAETTQSVETDAVINVQSDTKRKGFYSCACAQQAPLGLHPQSRPREWHPVLFFCLSFRAFKGAFHGGAAERSTEVHACQLPPSLPCQQARYWSVIDCCVVRDGRRECIELTSACVQDMPRKLCSASRWL